MYGYTDYEDLFDFLFHLRSPTWQLNKFSMNSISVLINWM